MVSNVHMNRNCISFTINMQLTPYKAMHSIFKTLPCIYDRMIFPNNVDYTICHSWSKSGLFVQIKAILFVVFYHRLINIDMIRLQDSTFHSMFNIRDNIIQNKKWMLVFHAIRRMEGKSFHDVFSFHNAAYRPNKIFSVALEVFSLLSSCRQRIS